MSSCGIPGCDGCTATFDDAYRQFFSVWETLITPAEERDITVAAQNATGINYLDVMVDKPKNP